MIVSFRYRRFQPRLTARGILVFDDLCFRDITRWVDDYQPGIVECRFIDAAGREWLFIEKLPLVTEDDSLCASSVYPIKGLIACQVLAHIEDLSRRRTVRITIENPWQVAAVDGQTIFDVLPEQIVKSPREAD